GIHNHTSAAMDSGLRADARPRNDEREAGGSLVIPDCRQSGKSGIHNHRSATMDSGLRADARPRNDEREAGGSLVIPDCRVAASPESIITGRRLWLPGSALTRGPGMTNGRSALVRHSGLPRSGKSGIHNHRSAAMDSGLRADARPRNDEPRRPGRSSFRIAAKAASPESIITGQRLWIPGSALTRGPGMTNGRRAARLSFRIAA